VSILRSGSRSRRGQAAVEFALVLPFLLIMLIGIIEFGRAWNLHQVITDAAREAARKGAIFDESVTEADVYQVAYDAMNRAGVTCPTPSPTGYTKCVKVENALGGQNTAVTVSINLPYTFTFFGPLVRWSTGQSSIELKTAFSMRNE